MACQSAVSSFPPDPIPQPINLTPPSPIATENLQQLRADPPTRDQLALAEQYSADGVPPSRTLAQPVSDTVGDTAVFWIKNQDNNTNQKITATLVHQSDLLNLWFEQGQEPQQRDLQTAVATLETQIIPTNRTFFGTEWQPGVDGDPRINILHAQNIGGGTIGYFSAADSFTQEINPYSNQREMMYISLDLAPFATADYYEVWAHEYQHMIQWNLDKNEDTWLNEGLSELAVLLNGYQPSHHIPSFTAQPNTQLTHFISGSTDYGAAFLFVTYLHDRLGADFVQQMLRDPANGINAIENTLTAHNSPLTFPQLVSDWGIANYLTSHNAAQDIYAYPSLPNGLPHPLPQDELTPNIQQTTALHQFGTDYLHLKATTPHTLIFTGTQQTPYLPTQPHSGNFIWTTLPGDSAHMSLTRPFDLTQITPNITPTLTFWTWYDLEQGWDYAYLSASTDQGQTWTTLPTIATTTANPHGNNLGHGYTGTSGSTTPPIWQQQTAFLQDYAGQKILLRFSTITDDAIYHPGLALDDIALPAIGYHDDAETDTGWQAHGFIRHTNTLPQTFQAQLILISLDGAVRVRLLPLTPQQQAHWQIPLTTAVPEAIIALTATTPATTLPATYSYQLQPNTP